MGPLGWQETLVIFVLALLLFGPKKLPELGKTIGKALTEFRRASSDLKSNWEREMVNLERENESLKEATSSVAKELNEITSSYAFESDSYNSLSCDSYDEIPSTVSASAPEGAESTEHVALDDGIGTDEVAAVEESADAGKAADEAPTGEAGTVPSQVAAVETEPEPKPELPAAAC
jgi:sec-independent protein translocase protein TatA